MYIFYFVVILLFFHIINSPQKKHQTTPSTNRALSYTLFSPRNPTPAVSIFIVAQVSLVALMRSARKCSARRELIKRNFQQSGTAECGSGPVYSVVCGGKFAQAAYLSCCKSPEQYPHPKKNIHRCFLRTRSMLNANESRATRRRHPRAVAPFP